MEFEILSAVCLMPLSMIIAAQSWNCMYIIFLVLPILLGMYHYRVSSKPKAKPRFFYAWLYTSFFFLLGVFELEVVPYLEILFIENFILMCFLSCLCLCIYYIRINANTAMLNAMSSIEKSQNKGEPMKRKHCDTCLTIHPLKSYHCEFCGFCIPQKNHHNLWLDVCIGAANIRLYVFTLIVLIVTCVYGADLTLTTICQPILFSGLFLIPEDCSEVFGDVHISICFVSSVYTLMMGVFALYLFIKQLWMICYNATYEEHQQGQMNAQKDYCKNIFSFCCRCKN